MRYCLILILILCLCACAIKPKKLTFSDIDTKKESYIQQYRDGKISQSECDKFINDLDNLS